MTVLLVDDVRRFRDGRDCLVATSAEEAARLLRQHDVEEIWLDHDLGRHGDGSARTVMPFVAELVRLAASGELDPLPHVLVHSANPAGALAIRRALEAAGYQVQRHHAPIWRHAW
jgi:hypothetical protein